MIWRFKMPKLPFLSFHHQNHCDHNDHWWSRLSDHDHWFTRCSNVQLTSVTGHWGSQNFKVMVIDIISRCSDVQLTSMTGHRGCRRLKRGGGWMDSGHSSSSSYFHNFGFSEHWWNNLWHTHTPLSSPSLPPKVFSLQLDFTWESVRKFEET